MRMTFLEECSKLQEEEPGFLLAQESAMNITMFTTKHENIIPHNEEIFPFVVSLSNHERAVHPSTGSGRTVKDYFSKQ